MTAYDSPIYIADAALYLMATQPELGIKDPYSLTSAQLDAAVSLLKQQKADVGEYWADYTKEVQAFESGTSVVGTTWQVIANTINSDGKTKVQTVVPKEGATGWSDTWMISSKAKHPNCMYEWMNYIVSPRSTRRWPSISVRHRRRPWPAGTPATSRSAPPTTRSTRRTPARSTTGPRRRSSAWTAAVNNCTDYSQWVDKWQQIKG